MIALATILTATACLSPDERPTERVEVSTTMTVLTPSPSPTPDPTPSATAVPTPAPLASVPASGAVVQAIRDVWPDATEDKAIAVAGCETGRTYNPRATNGDHFGIFQLRRKYHEWRANALGFDWAQIFDPIVNAKVALHLFKEQGWGPWTCARILGIA